MPERSSKVKRRDFLKIFGIFLLLSFIGSMVLSLFRKCKREIVERERMKVADIDLLKRQKFVKAVVKGEPIIIIYEREEILALSLTCPHRGCVVSTDNVDKGFLECPCHGSKFDLKGKRLEGPSPEDLRKLEIEIEKKDVYVLL